MAMCDLFIIEDSLQYVKRDYINRVKIFYPNKEVKWLSVSVTFNSGDLIKDVSISEDFILKNHYKTIQATYGTSINFPEFSEELKDIYFKNYDKLIDLNLDLIDFIKKLLDIQTKISYLSDLETIGIKSEFIIEICNQVNANKYLSGLGGKDYLDEELFKEKDIELVYQNVIHPIYPQKNDEFTEGLSIIDFIMNCPDYKTTFWNYVEKSRKKTFI
jgi:hypothetical protein